MSIGTRPTSRASRSLPAGVRPLSPSRGGTASSLIGFRRPIRALTAALTVAAAFVTIGSVPATADTAATSADVCAHWVPTSDPNSVVADGSENPLVVTGNVGNVCVAAPNLTIVLSGDTAHSVEVDIYSDADNTTVVGGMPPTTTLSALIKSDESDCWSGVTCSSHAPTGTVVMAGAEFDNVENVGDAWGCIRSSLPCDGNGGIGSATLNGGGGNDQMYFHENTDFPDAPIGQQSIHGDSGSDTLGTICTTSDGSTSTPCIEPPAIVPRAVAHAVSTYHRPILYGGRGNDHITDRIRRSVVHGGKGYDVCRVAKTVTTYGCEVVKRIA